MTNKSTELYERIFKYIEKNIFKLQPARFMADFESGLRKAIKNCYPYVALNGCWYHYCCSIRRRLVSIHMHQFIENHHEARIIYRKLLSLPLLPAQSIVGGFDMIKAEAKAHGIYKEFKKFFEYFNDYWLELVMKKNIKESIEHILSLRLFELRTIFVQLTPLK